MIYSTRISRSLKNTLRHYLTWHCSSLTSTTKHLKNSEEFPKCILIGQCDSMSGGILHWLQSCVIHTSQAGEGAGCLQGRPPCLRPTASVSRSATFPRVHWSWQCHYPLQTLPRQRSLYLSELVFLYVMCCVTGSVAAVLSLFSY